MIPSPRFLCAVAATAGLALMGGCATVKSMTGSTDTSSSPSSSTSSPAPAAPAAPKSTAGMNANGEVVDSKKVEAGSGQRVKGIGDWEGEITGKPAPGSKFSQLQIGMGMKQVTDIVGQPSDQGAYLTGKAWIPFYFGSDRYRQELVYKGMGRLIFASSSGMDISAGHLVWIINNATEPAYR